MAHVYLVVDGKEMFNDDIEGWHMPPPVASPPAPDFGPQVGLPIQVRCALVLALGKAIARSLNEGPLLQPATARFEPSASGFTLVADVQ